MKGRILTYINKLEGFKTAIKSLHWNSSSLPQHQLCDDIAEEIANHQDQVSEVEQAIHGNLPFNQLKGTTYKVTSLRKFVEDVIHTTTLFYNHLHGNQYIGMKSDCESFLSNMQRKLYLVNFTLKEEMKNSIKDSLNENQNVNQYLIESPYGDTITLSEGELKTLINYSIGKVILMKEDKNDNDKAKIRRSLLNLINSTDYECDFEDLIPNLEETMSNCDVVSNFNHWEKDDKINFEITTATFNTIGGYIQYKENDEGFIAELDGRIIKE